MKISITSGTASSNTELAAFDDCLQKCGVANQNLIYLSSIIPPDSEIIFEQPHYDDTHFGNKLYVVIAQHRETRPGHEAWAGIGWVQDPVTKKGLFVEHEGSSEAEVKRDINNTLSNMVSRRADVAWTEIQMVVKGVRCENQPVCAVVVASYKSEGWN